MSQLLILMVLAIVGYIVWRRFAPPGSSTKPVEKRDATTLERDPRTGVYHPSEHDRS